MNKNKYNKTNYKLIAKFTLAFLILILIYLILVFFYKNYKGSLNSNETKIKVVDLGGDNITNDNLSESNIMKFENNDVFLFAGFEESINSITEGLNADYVPETIWGYNNLGIANVDNHLNIRETPDSEGKLIGKMSNNDGCEILDIVDDTWAHIKSGEIEGYCHIDYLLTGADALYQGRKIITPVATVTASALKVREAPNTDCRIITQVPKGEELKVLEFGEDWVKIDLDDEDAYVAYDFVDIEERLGHAISITELLYGDGVSDVRVDLCQYAKTFIGNPYVWGGTSLTKGCDCSGFVMKLYAHYDVTIPRTSRTQATAGTVVPLDKVRPGDLIFYTRGKSINHVALYVGNGQVVHASSPKTGIKISGMYYRTPYKAVSFLP